MVATEAGRTKRKDRRKAAVERLSRADSESPLRACLIGFRALTKPSRMKKIATQLCPEAMRRKIGRWKRYGV